MFNWYTSQMHAAAQVCHGQGQIGFCKHIISSEWQLHHTCAGMVDAAGTPKSGVARLTEGHK